MSSRLNDPRRRHDKYFHRARKEGYVARAVYKLSFIDDKHHIFAPGQRVLDLGCRPGSWLQYASGKVGVGGQLVGLDRTPIDLNVPRTRTLTGDVMVVSPKELLGDLPAFDVVLTDMAPDTTGVRHLDQSRSEVLFERAVDIACATLAPGGHFVGKLFLGPDFERLRNRMRTHFDKVAMVKPPGSRQESIEQYMVGLRFAPPAAP